MYVDYKSKIAAIININQRARIFVGPMLPTKHDDLIRKALFFNNLLFNDLLQSYRQVSLVHGFNRFLDSNNKLSADLAEGPDDPLPHIHINDIGRRILCASIKTSIFQRKRAKGSQFSGMLYSSVVSLPPR